MKSLIIILAILLMSINTAKADNSPEGVFKGTAGVLTGAPVGFFTGLVKGSVNHAQSFTRAIQDGFGEETTISKIISYPLGYVSGGITGAFAGAVKGVSNGIYYGVKEPFSDESYTVDGDFEDFDAFDYSNYSKASYGSL